MHRVTVCGWVVVLLLALAACGGDRAPTTPSNPNGGGIAASEGTLESEVAEASQHVTLGAGNDLKYTPETLTAAVGRVTLSLENRGVMEHNVTWADETSATEPFLYAAGGQTVTNTRTFDASGVYDFYCTIPGHREAGMVGALIIEDEEK